ncbi:MAG: hypothetical protein Q8R02_21055 [Hyphomonadaceae bacterium]|nr:hypothetical protein [Hyphomonadaceae bacterium]
MRLDALVQLSAVSATSPAGGDVYILPAGKGAASWSAFADEALAC